MIFIDQREPGDVQTEISIAVRDTVRVLQLPWGDFWITPWADTPALTLPENLGQLLEVLQAIQVPLAQFMQECGCDLPDLADNAGVKDAFAHWLSARSLVIESKTPQDFFNTWKGGRLEPQALNMSSHSPNCLLVIKGYIYPTADENQVKLEGSGVLDWNYWAFIDKVTSLSLAGVPVVFTTRGRFPDYLGHLALWFRKERTPVRPPKPQSLVPLKPEAAFLCGLPGIGPKLANSVMEWTGGLKHAMIALTDPDTANMKERPDGLGPKTIQKVREFMGLCPDELMSPVPIAPPWDGKDA